MLKRAFLLLLVCLSGCAVANFTSVKDPAYANHQGFRRVLVYTTNMTLPERQKLETTIVNEFRIKGITAFKTLDLLPPTRTFEKEYIKQVLATHEIDSVLIVSLGGKDVQTGYVPNLAPTTTTGTVSTIGNTSYVNAQTYGGGGGFYVSKTLASYSATLYEAGTENVVWMADGSASGGGASTFNDLAWAAGAGVVKKLVADGLYRKE